VDFSKGAIVALAVVLAIGYAAANRGVYVFGLIHHIYFPPLKV
jgi:hypothetical protein